MPPILRLVAVTRARIRAAAILAAQRTPRGVEDKECGSTPVP